MIENSKPVHTSASCFKEHMVQHCQIGAPLRVEFNWSPHEVSRNASVSCFTCPSPVAIVPWLQYQYIQQLVYVDDPSDFYKHILYSLYIYIYIIQLLYMYAYRITYIIVSGLYVYIYIYIRICIYIYICMFIYIYIYMHM